MPVVLFDDRPLNSGMTVEIGSLDWIVRRKRKRFSLRFGISEQDHDQTAYVRESDGM